MKKSSRVLRRREVRERKLFTAKYTKDAEVEGLG